MIAPSKLSVHDDPIQIVSAADNNYAMTLAVALFSILKNLNQKQKVVFFILDGGIRKDTLDKIKRMLESPRSKVNIIRLNQKLLRRYPTCGHINWVAYSRLLLPELLPLELKKIIWIDADMVFLRDISPLWDFYQEDVSLFAANDCYFWTIQEAIPYWKEAGLPPDAPYFNSGLMVLNLDRIRKLKFMPIWFAYLERYSKQLMYAEQDALNATMIGEWKKINRQWNRMSCIHFSKPWHETPFAEEEHFQLIQDPYGLHFTGASKPWKSECQHPNLPDFYQYLDQTPWQGWRPGEPLKVKLKKWLRPTYRWLRDKQSTCFKGKQS